MEKNKSIISNFNSKTDLPLIKDAPDIWGGGTMLIPNPKEVMKIMDSVKYGTVITLDDIREKLSKKYKTTITCPMTTGIFVSLVSKASNNGEVDVPYWRTLKKNYELNSKFPGGLECHVKQLKAEGHIIIQKGKKYFLDR